MSENTGETPAAGWYPDPEQEHLQRWWDGRQWTDATQPRVGATSPPSPKDARSWWQKKRITVPLVIVVLLVGFATLGGNGDEAEELAEQDAADSVEEDEPGGAEQEGTEEDDAEEAEPDDDALEDLAVGDTGRSDGIEVTVHDVVDPYDGYDDMTAPDDGSRYVLVEVELTNADRDDSVNVNTDLESELRDADGRSYSTEIFIGDSAAGDLRQGESLLGDVGFEVPEDVHDLEFRYAAGFLGETVVFDLDE